MHGVNATCSRCGLDGPHVLDFCVSLVCVDDRSMDDGLHAHDESMALCHDCSMRVADSLARWAELEREARDARDTGPHAEALRRDQGGGEGPSAQATRTDGADMGDYDDDRWYLIRRLWGDTPSSRRAAGDP